MKWPLKRAYLHHFKSIQHIFSLTPLSSFLLGAVNVILQLDADLPLVGQVSDEWVPEELLCAGSLAVAFQQTALYE